MIPPGRHSSIVCCAPPATLGANGRYMSIPSPEVSFRRLMCCHWHSNNGSNHFALHSVHFIGKLLVRRPPRVSILEACDHTVHKQLDPPADCQSTRSLGTAVSKKCLPHVLLCVMPASTDVTICLQNVTENWEF